MIDMERTRARARLRQLAEDSIKRGDPTGWFDDLYRGAAGDTEAIPWAHLRPNTLLTEWLTSNPPSGAGQKALVVGCGLGDRLLVGLVVDGVGVVGARGELEDEGRAGGGVDGADGGCAVDEWNVRAVEGVGDAAREALALDDPWGLER